MRNACLHFVQFPEVELLYVIFKHSAPSTEVVNMSKMFYQRCP